MITVTTFNDLQCAINDGEPFIDINGTISAPNQHLMIEIENDGITTIRGGRLDCQGIVADGFMKLALKEFMCSTTSNGIVLRDGIQFSLSDSYIASVGHGIVLESIAAFWSHGYVQLNSLSGATNSGMVIGDSSLGYEAVYVNDMLIEGYQNGIMIGGAGNNVNMRFKGITIDKSGNPPANGSTGFYLRPTGSAEIRNIEIDNFWINGRDYPILMNVLNTIDRIDRVVIGDGLVLGCSHDPVTVFGDTSRVSWGSNGTIMTGPIEAGS